MGLQRIPRQAFNRGKISEFGLARTDVKRAELCAEEQTNWMPRVLGSMMLRPGWKYLGSTLSDTQAFLIPFIKSTNDTAFLEFTNGSLRIWESDAVLKRNTVSTTIRGGDFSADITNFNKLTDPSSLPTAGGTESHSAFSADGQFLAHASASTSPYVTIYYISGSTFTALANLSPLPSSCFGVAFSPDSSILAITDGGNVRLYYPVGSGASTVWTQVSANPAATLPNGGRGLNFSADGTMLTVSYVITAPFNNVYSVSINGASSTLTKLTDGDTSQFANSADLPTSNGRISAFSWDGRFLAVGVDSTPFVFIYSVNGTTFTKLANPASLPAGGVQGLAFSRDGNYLACGHAITPFITIYSISGTTFTKLSNPATLPASTGAAVDFTSDNQFLAIAHTTTPFVTIYRNVSGTWTKQTNPGTLPDGNGYGCAFSWNNRFLAINHATSQFITLYECYQWLDMDGSGATSAYATSNSYSNSSSWLTTDGDTGGVGFSGATIRQYIDTSDLTTRGTKVKITFKGRAADTFTIDKCYIGYASGIGANFSFAPTQVTFSSGTAGFTLSGATTITSDEITFNTTVEADIMISFHIVSTADGMGTLSNGGANSASTKPYYKLSVDEASTLSVTGYTDYGATMDVLGISLIQVLENTGTNVPGLSLTGTNYNDARRVQAVSVLNADKTVEHGIRITIAQGIVDFHVGAAFGDDDLVTKRILGAGVYSFAFTPNVNLFFVEIHSNTTYSTIVSSIQIDGGGDLTLNTVYETADLTHLRHAQSGDVIYLACQNQAQYKVMRFASHSWGVAQYLPEDGPFRNLNPDFTTLTASALTGNITITSSKDYFKKEMVGALFRISSVGQATQDSFTGANQFSSGNIKVTGVGTSRDLSIVRSGTWTATVTLQRSIGTPGTWVDVATFTSNGTATYNDALDNQTIYYRVGIKTGNYTSGTAVISMSYASGSQDGIARITAWTSQTLVSAIVLSPMGGTTAFETWNEGVWSDYRGWPSAVAIYEGRLAWAGMDRIILSESDGYENFDDTVEGDSGPIIRQIGEGPVDDIHWLLPLQRLIAGAEGSELSIRSNSFDEPLTPDNYNMKAASTQGSAPVGAVRIDSNGVFVERSGTRVYQLLYNFDTYDYSSSDLTRLVPDTCQAGIVKIVIQRHPDTRLHCILADGTVSMLVFEPDEDVICWIDITTDGLIEDAVVLPQEELEDAVYYVVNRTINGVTKRYIEKWALETECIGGTLNKQADSFLIYQGAATSTITGLSHLEGESVVVWGGGSSLGTFTVSSGQITGISPTVTNAIVGLGYQARYKSGKLAYAAESGTALNARKRIASIGIIAANMHNFGLKYGDSFDFLYDLPQVFKGGTVTDGTIHAQYDDDTLPINASWDTDTRLCLTATAPKPVTMMAVTIVIDTNA